MSLIDKFQQAWQSQCNLPLDVNPDRLLMAARLERRIYLGADIFIILVFLGVGASMLRFTLEDIQNNWPWLIYVASTTWVVGYILYDRFLRRRKDAQYCYSVLTNTERSIKDLEHRMWLDQHTLWWYLLPIALGCMIPPIISFFIDVNERPLADGLLPLLTTEAFFLAIFYVVHWIMKTARCFGIKGQQQKLQALRELREHLLAVEKSEQEI